MRIKTLRLLWSSLLLLTLCAGAAEVGALAAQQRRNKPSRRVTAPRHNNRNRGRHRGNKGARNESAGSNNAAGQNNNPVNPVVATVAADHKPQICANLNDIMLSANDDYTEFPFDENTPTANFVTDCLGGKLSWQAIRRFDDAAPINTKYNLTITFNIQDLDAQSFSAKNGVIHFAAKSPLRKIAVQGTTTNLGDINSLEPEWRLDLRHRKAAEKFVEYLKNLSAAF